jgi:signal peptidase I
MDGRVSASGAGAETGPGPADDTTLGSGGAGGDTPQVTTGKDSGAPVASDSGTDTDRGTVTEESGGEEPGTGETATGETGSEESGAEESGAEESATRKAAAEETAPGKTTTTVRPRLRRRRRRRSFWREFPILVAVALLLAVVIKTYALQAFFIPSGSMENTLEVNDRVLINKVVYDFRGIHRGDIVVFNGDGSWDPGTVPTSSNFVSEFFTNLTGMFGFGHPGAIYVKRVIGLPGDDVACCNAQGRVTVNGVPLTEGSYMYPGDVPSMIRFNIVVPKDRLWVMGDHRSVSDDSRGHLGDPGGGTIPESAVLGRAFVIIWPQSRWRFLPIPSTFEQPALNKQKSSAAASGGDSAADLLGARLQPEGPALPLSLGFAGAVPLTWAQRRIRLRAGKRRGRESP